MDLTQIFQTAAAVIASVGGAGVIIIGVSSWLARIIADQLNARTSARYEKEIEQLKNQYRMELERLKGEIGERRDALANLLDLLSSGYSTSHKRVLDSIEMLWKGVVEIHDLASQCWFFHSILLPQEYENQSIEKYQAILPTMTVEEFAQHVECLHNVANDIRPFIGEDLFTAYMGLHTYAMRLSWKVIQGKSEGRIYRWNKNLDGTRDDVLERHLQAILDEGELDTVLAGDQLNIPFSILAILESKILALMNELVFGRQFVTMSIEEYGRINELLSPIHHPGSSANP